jgi:hypothetical protein
MGETQESYDGIAPQSTRVLNPRHGPHRYAKY